MLSDDIAAVRLNSDKVLETTADGVHYGEATGSSGRLIPGGNNEVAPQRSRLKFANLMVEDEDGVRWFYGVKGTRATRAKRGRRAHREKPARRGFPESRVFQAQSARMGAASPYWDGKETLEALRRRSPPGR